MTKQLVACAIADIHLSSEPPRFRTVEDNWLEVQRNYLEQVFTVANNNGNPVPLLIAGDIFDKAQPPPEIINFALDVFANQPFPIYAIPGNHDLPNHRYEEIDKSAYGTLVKSKRICTIPPGEFITSDYKTSVTGYIRCRIYGFPCGTEVKTLEKPLEKGQYYSPGGFVEDKILNIALVHSYIWASGFCYLGAPIDQQVPSYRKKIKGYDVAIFGDNHQGFSFSKENNCGQCSILNCGTLLRRKSDEIATNPSVGLIYSDGSVERKPLYVLDDKYVDILQKEKKEETKQSTEEKEALEAFASIGEQSYNFAEFLRHLSQNKNWRVRVKELILESVER